MAWFRQLCLSWIILSAAAACVSCQELTSTLREGNRTCPGKEVVFTCTVRGPSTLSFLTLAWSSTEYISRSLQLSTADMLGEEVATSTSMDGSVTAIARVTNITNVTGVLVLESTLRITAVEASVVTCMSGADRGTESVEFSVSAVPEVPQMISAAEISRPRNDICIILVQWSPPANSDPSDIDQYIVYVPSQNIRNDISSFTLITLTLLNCGGDIRIQVAAVNSVGCVGLNSSKVLPVPLDSIPTAPATSEGGSATTTEGGSASTSSQLGAGAAAGITLAVIVIVGICILSGVIAYIYRYFKKKDGKRKELVGPNRIHADNGSGMELTELKAYEEKYKMLMEQLELQKHEEQQEKRKEQQEKCRNSPEECLRYLYSTLSQKNSVNGTLDETSDSDIISAVDALRAVLKKKEASVIRSDLVNSLMILKGENPDDMQRALDYLMKLIPDNMSNEVKDELVTTLEILKDENPPDDMQILLEKALDSMIRKIPPPDRIKKILLRLCDMLFEKLLKLSSPKQEIVLRNFDIPLNYLKSLTTKDLESEEEDVQVKMLVHEISKGTEEGKFLVVDMLDIDHLRVRHINVVEGRVEKLNCEEFKDGEMAVDFINECITKFITNKKIRENLSITFTFPFRDTSGKLIRWTREPKGASEEIKNMEVDVAAAVSDATGILLAMGNKEPDCCIGISFRNRANACYMEELDAGDCKVINMEWGASDDDGQLDQWRTDYDGQLDDNPQLFEKMISEEQQGVIVCHVLKYLHSKNELFVEQRDTELNFDKFEAFCKGGLGIIEGWNIETCKSQLKRRFEIEASNRDCVVIQRVCEAVSIRAARLAAAGIVAIVKKIDKIDGCTVAVDSSLYIQHPQFLERIQVTLKELELELELESNIKIKPIEYGSQLSADFAAAVLQYCVGPPPSSSPGSSKGSEGQRGQQENIQSDAAEEHEAAKNLISADVEVHPQPGDIELIEVESSMA